MTFHRILLFVIVAWCLVVLSAPAWSEGFAPNWRFEKDMRKDWIELALNNPKRWACVKSYAGLLTAAWQPSQFYTDPKNSTVRYLYTTKNADRLAFVILPADILLPCDSEAD